VMKRWDLRKPQRWKRDCSGFLWRDNIPAGKATSPGWIKPGRGEDESHEERNCVKMTGVPEDSDRVACR